MSCRRCRSVFKGRSFGRPKRAMRKLVVTENITVDGVIDMAAGWFDPLAKDVDQSDIIATNAEHSAAADALLVGRNTFEAFETSGPSRPTIRPVCPTTSTA